MRSDLDVAPASRRGGVARTLMLAAQDLARARGARKLELSTTRTNLAAQALYESLGWVRSEQFLTYGKPL